MPGGTLESQMLSSDAWRPILSPGPERPLLSRTHSSSTVSDESKNPFVTRLLSKLPLRSKARKTEDEERPITSPNDDNSGVTCLSLLDRQVFNSDDLLFSITSLPNPTTASDSTNFSTEWSDQISLNAIFVHDHAHTFLSRFLGTRLYTQLNLTRTKKDAFYYPFDQPYSSISLQDASSCTLVELIAALTCDAGTNLHLLESVLYSRIYFISGIDFCRLLILRYAELFLRAERKLKLSLAPVMVMEDKHREFSVRLRVVNVIRKWIELCPWEFECYQLKGLMCEVIQLIERESRLGVYLESVKAKIAKIGIEHAASNVGVWAQPSAVEKLRALVKDEKILKLLDVKEKPGRRDIMWVEWPFTASHLGILSPASLDVDAARVIALEMLQNPLGVDKDLLKTLGLLERSEAQVIYNWIKSNYHPVGPNVSGWYSTSSIMQTPGPKERSKSEPVHIQPFDTLCAMDPTQFAGGLSARSRKNFSGIPLREFYRDRRLGYQWQRPGIAQCTKEFNQTTKCSLVAILNSNDRLLVLSRLVTVAELCQRTGNHDSGVALTAAIVHGAVQPLHSLLSEAQQNVIADLQREYNSSGNFRLLRQNIRKEQRQSVPFVGAILSELLRVEDSGLMWRSANQLNIAKVRILGARFSEIAAWQRRAALKGDSKTGDVVGQWLYDCVG